MGLTKRLWAHPRACGENYCVLAHIPELSGSSPRMRGKPTVQKSHSTRSGLIPAHAGKTSARRPNYAPPWAHPRACGENREIAFGNWYEQGSSPRMRGKRRGLTWNQLPPGLIPAHAGKTSAAAKPPSPPVAHPRACGENSCDCVSVIYKAGSSPRMRGKHGQV